MLLQSVAGFPSLHATSGCSDHHDSCVVWANGGECQRNPGFMKLQCAQSCDSCGWAPGMLAPPELWVVEGEEDRIMRPRQAGTCAAEPPGHLRWGVDRSTSVSICCHNRKGAEPTGYWESTRFYEEAQGQAEIRFADVATGKLLFVAPRNRSLEVRASGCPRVAQPSVA